MKNGAVVLAVVGLGLGYWAWSRSTKAAIEQGDTAGPWEGYSFDPGAISSSIFDVLTSPVQSVAESVDQMTSGIFKISKMSQVTPDLLANQNVRATLRMIRRGEGTADEAGYRRIFGGRMFEGFADHPRIKVTASGYTSTAAGAYQFLASTWDETARILGLKDFSPASQDLAAVARFVYRGALDDILAGRIAQALPKLGKEWASMPGSPYGQPTISQQTAMNTYRDNGGFLA